MEMMMGPGAASKTVRDLHDWITGFGSLRERMREKLARPAPDYRARAGRLSSTLLGWRDLGLEQYDLAPGDGAVPAKAGRHLLILSLGTGSLVLDDATGPVSHAVRPGSVVLVPGNPGLRWGAGSPLRVCVLTLDARRLDRVAADTYKAARDFELQPMLRDYDFGVIGLVGVLAEEAMRGGRGNNLYVSSLASILAVHLLRHYAKWKRKEPSAGHAPAFERALEAPEPVQRAVVHIRENHTRDIGVKEIADAAGVDPFVLRRLFYESLGTEPGQYLLQLRMQSAESLLAAGASSLPEIAQAVGFGDQGALSAKRTED